MNWFDKIVQETEEEREEVMEDHPTPIRPRVREETEERRILSTDEIPSYRPVPLYENERWPGNRHRRQQFEQSQRTNTRVIEREVEKDTPTPSRAFRPSEVPSPIFGMRKKPEMPELSKEAREARVAETKPKGQSTSDIGQIEEKLTPLHAEKQTLFVEQEEDVVERVNNYSNEPIEMKMPTFPTSSNVEEQDEELSTPFERSIPEERQEEIVSEEVDDGEPSVEELIISKEHSIEETLNGDTSFVEDKEMKGEEENVEHLEERLIDETEDVLEEAPLAEQVLEEGVPEEELLAEQVLEEGVPEEELLDEQVLEEGMLEEESLEEQTPEEQESEEERTLPFNVLMLSSDKRKLDMAEKIKRARRNV